MKQAKIMIGRCNDKRPFAIRVEYENNDWVRTWAFELSERMLKNERYGEEKITGSFYATREYPGCPHLPQLTKFLAPQYGQPGYSLVA